jgi:hypothetical protein
MHISLTTRGRLASKFSGPDGTLPATRCEHLIKGRNCLSLWFMVSEQIDTWQHNMDECSHKHAHTFATSLLSAVCDSRSKPDLLA